MIDDHYAAARAAWPDVDVERAAFAAYLAERAGAAHATDLYLACGVARGQADALGAFERTLLADVALFVAHVDRSPEFVDELRQQLRTKLFVAPEPHAPPKIAEYSGSGPLRGWLRVAAVRTALNMKRGDRPSDTIEDDELGDRTAGGDPQLAYFRSLYRDELQRAFQAALATLSTDERNVLRLHYLDGLNIDKIGALHQVHRATVARWLERSRDTIASETRRVLAEQLSLDDGELDSLIAFVQSQLDVSIRRLL